MWHRLILICRVLPYTELPYHILLLFLIFESSCKFNHHLNLVQHQQEHQPRPQLEHHQHQPQHQPQHHPQQQPLVVCFESCMKLLPAYYLSVAQLLKHPRIFTYSYSELPHHILSYPIPILSCRIMSYSCG
jgi:hypothetical protein